MCDWGNTTEVEVTIPADLSCTGQSRVAVKPIDSCIAAIVRALNQGGVLTRSSCCGHGKEPGRIDLVDGRSLVIVSQDRGKQ